MKERDNYETMKEATHLYIKKIYMIKVIER
jgi:hypothetical protein